MDLDGTPSTSLAAAPLASAELLTTPTVGVVRSMTERRPSPTPGSLAEAPVLGLTTALELEPSSSADEEVQDPAESSVQRSEPAIESQSIAESPQTSAPARPGQPGPVTAGVATAAQTLAGPDIQDSAVEKPSGISIPLRQLQLAAAAALIVLLATTVAMYRRRRLP